MSNIIINNDLTINGTGYTTTPPDGDNSNKIATTNWVKNNIVSGSGNTYFSQELDYENQIDITPSSVNWTTYKYKVTKAGCIIGYLRSTINASIGAPIISIQRNGISIQTFGSSVTGGNITNFNDIGSINIPVEINDIITLSCYHDETKLDLNFCSLNFIPYKYNKINTTYVYPILDWKNTKWTTIPATTASSSDKLVTSYTAPENGVCYIYAQTEQVSSKFCGLKYRIVYNDSSNINFNVNAISGTNTSSALTSTILINKNDILQVYLQANYSNILSGSIIFVPYKYTDITELSSFKEYAAHMAMPSTKSVSIKISGSSTTYVAPADGYISYRVTATASNQWISLSLLNTNLYQASYSLSNNSVMACNLPISKGQSAQLNAISGISFSEINANFTYCNGSVPV